MHTNLRKKKKTYKDTSISNDEQIQMYQVNCIFPKKKNKKKKLSIKTKKVKTAYFMRSLILKHLEINYD